MYYDFYCKTSTSKPSSERPVSGIVIYHNELMEFALAVQELVVCKWSAKFGNKRCWFKCKPNGILIDASNPVDVVFWRAHTDKDKTKIELPYRTLLEDEYYSLYPDKSPKYIKYGTVEMIAELGFDRLKTTTTAELEKLYKQRHMSGPSLF